MKFLFSVLTNVVALLANGFALQLLWGWFVVPTFYLPVLTFPIAIGIILIACIFTGAYNVALDTEDGRLKIILTSFLVPAYAVAAGFIVRLFM